jgi:hypothetical protein
MRFMNLMIREKIEYGKFKEYVLKIMKEVKRKMGFVKKEREKKKENLISN